MDEKKRKRVNMLTLAFGIAFMPPIWALLSPYLGVSTGAVALICAGLYVANGNKRKDALKIMETLPLHPNVELYCTLFVLGGLAVLIGESLPKWIFVPSWLCGWAIGLTIMGPLPVAELGSLPIQIGVAMIAGVVYVGIGVDALQKWLVRKIFPESR